MNIVRLSVKNAEITARTQIAISNLVSISRKSWSINPITIKIEKKMHIIIDWTLKSITRKVIIYKNAFSISTKGYLNEILLPHFLHFLLRRSS